MLLIDSGSPLPKDARENRKDYRAVLSTGYSSVSTGARTILLMGLTSSRSMLIEFRGKEELLRLVILYFGQETAREPEADGVEHMRRAMRQPNYISHSTA